MATTGRLPNTNTRGGAWTQDQINAVWLKGRLAPAQDPNVVRADACGALIERVLHGQITPRGWEIDHINPVANGGTDDLANLQPLQWQNNRQKGDATGPWTCART